MTSVGPTTPPPFAFMRPVLVCRLLIVVAVGVMVVSPAPRSSAQTVERRLFTVGDALRRDLDAHQLDISQIAEVANGVVEGLQQGNATPILDHADRSVRITLGASNKVMDKDQLAAYVQKLLDTPDLAQDVMANDEVIVRDDEVGLARGTIWIKQQCLDDACSKKKSSIVTINLP